MMKRSMKILLLMALYLQLCTAAVLAQVAILCYHEVDRPNDVFAVTSVLLDKHLAYLKSQNYHFVSLDEYLAYTKGEIQLPEKSVMITFDDGYESFYTKTFPLLKKYNVPGMLAIVTSWTDGEGKPLDVQKLATWEQLQTMEQSGLVTVVTHSHALHKQQAIDPQGDRNGVAGSHLYLNDCYETDEEYRTRIDNDMSETQRIFQEHLGHPSKAMVWPYGIYTKESVDSAIAHGMEATFLLDGGTNPPEDKSRLYAKRMIISSDMNVEKLGKLMTTNHDEWNSKPLRMAQVDIDNIYRKSPQDFQRNIQNTIDLLLENNINLVALQAFSDTDGDGNVDEVYFHNTVVPVAADIFNSVSNKLLQQGLTVVAWIPGLSYRSLAATDGSNLVQSKSELGWYQRLSPFDRENEEKLKALYYDLARYTTSDGILFQDDMYLNEGEDVSPAGKAAYEKAFGTPFPVGPMNAGQKESWKKLKTQRLTELSMSLADSYRRLHPNAVIMRDIYDAPLTDPESTEWFAQDYADFLKNYDYTVVMAYPYMNEADDPDSFLREVAASVKAFGGTDKTIVKVQSYDWKRERWLDGKTFRHQLMLLEKEGIRNLGYYPNCFYEWPMHKQEQ